jgi:hypothetical protein
MGFKDDVLEDDGITPQWKVDEMTDTIQIPEELRQMAEQMGVDVDTIVQNLTAQHGGQQSQGHRPLTYPSGQAAGIGGVGVSGGIPAQTADGVDTVATETPEQKLQRELAVAQQELQQTRGLMQTMQDGRVVGSSGLSGPVVDTPPNLGGIEPGLRWAVRNGLVELEKIADPLIRDLFKNDLGGVI